VAIWYNIRDDYSMLCCGPTIHSAGYWGLVQHNDTTLKAGFAVFRQLAGGTLPSPTGTGGGTTGGSSGGSSGGSGSGSGTGEGSVPTPSSGGGGSGGTSSSTIQSVPCTVTMNGQQVSGSCSGTFSTSGSGGSGTPPTTQMVPPTK
jgi:hypothetical protein